MTNNETTLTKDIWRSKDHTIRDAIAYIPVVSLPLNNHKIIITHNDVLTFLYGNAKHDGHDAHISVIYICLSTISSLFAFFFKTQGGVSAGQPPTGAIVIFVNFGFRLHPRSFFILWYSALDAASKWTSYFMFFIQRLRIGMLSLEIFILI